MSLLAAVAGAVRSGTGGLAASVLSGDLNGSQAAGNPSGVVTSNTCTISASGGTGPYTYAWTVTTPDGNFGSPSFSAASSNATSVSDTVDYALGAGGGISSGECRCRVTDSVSATYDVFVPFLLQNTSI
jgi:hypothetical protein